MHLAINESRSPSTQGSFSPLPLAERNRLIEETLSLVESLAVELLRVHRFPMACEDLVSCGTRALVEAAAAFDANRGVRFSTFAYWRVRGAMLDANRNGQGLCSRSEMTRMRSDARPRDVEVGGGRARASRLQRITYRAADLLTTGCALTESENAVETVKAWTDPEADTPETSTHVTLLRERVRKGIAALSPRQRQVLELLYYHHDGSYQAVADVLGVGRPHIFRIHARALARLRRHLSDLATH